jgi:excisionase family DNA binding protein
MTISRERYYSIEEIAVKLSVGYHVIRNLIVAGQMRATKVGKQWRVQEEDLNIYLESRTVEIAGSEAPVFTSKAKTNSRFY